MKTRESGMPEEATWESFFDPEWIMDVLGVGDTHGDVVEFGCGYGTFTMAAARIVKGSVYALDIDADMVVGVHRKARDAGLTNVYALPRDFVQDNSGLADATVGYAMLFNILHCERPVALLTEARRVLVPGGRAGIIHWNCDASTPRGPSMTIRPTPEQCIAWAQSAGFSPDQPCVVDLPPYHYGVRLIRDG